MKNIPFTYEVMGLLVALFIIGFTAYQVDRVITSDRIDAETSRMAEQNAHDERLAELHSPCSRVVN